ncbi:MAG TPA: two-component regulator propeller domain-containing protein, partial [Saprospiraceae bacterium]|nr:two-component regulator propeller domain-containing protein [Saprospiraceae bacterium]
MSKLTYIFFFLTCLSARAQTPVFRLRETKELGEAHTTKVFQDSRGWLWFGAEKGLYRYDGLAFQPVGLPDSLTGAVSALFEWNGRIWAGFDNGLIGYMEQNSAFVPATNAHKQYTAHLRIWAPEEGLPQKTIKAFAADSTGGFWIATYGEGLYCLKNNRLYQFSAAEDGLGSDEIYALACDGKGRIWAATDAGISICTMPVPGKKEVQRLTTTDGLPDEIVTTLLADKRGNIWIGTHEKGICHYDVFQQKFDYQTNQWSYGTVLNLTVFGSAELWAGTENSGLLRLELVTGAIQPQPLTKSLRPTRIHALSKDREGLLWIVTDKGEVYSSNVRFGMLAAPFDNPLSVLVDRRNRIWAGNSEGLVLLENGVKKSVVLQKQSSKPANVIALWESPADGNIWAGTFENGVYVVNGNGKMIRHLTTRNGLFDDNVLSVAGDNRTVWLATFGGVTTFDLQTNQYARLDELGNGYVYKVFLDSKRRVWFGTDGKGLIVLENGKFSHFTEANGRPLKTIYSITEDRRGHIWFSTDKDGLYRYDGRLFHRYDSENHLHSLSFTGLATDGNGQIMIAYDDGVDVLNPDRPDHVTFCDGAIGAPIAEVNLNALCCDARGNVWLGARQGIMRIAAFDEAFMDDPQPGITAVSVFSKTIDFQANNRFAHDQNYFFFNFTGLWYSDPESVRYRYRLDGADLDWKVSKDHLASYPSLRPGRYTFRVQTSEHGNFEKVPEVTWSFVIEPPIWARWWFIVLCAVSAAGLFYTFIRSREERLRREAQLKREKVESQFAALKSQINPHFLFNSFNTLITIIEENPKIAVEYVEHLSDFYRSIIVYRERDFISLQEEMDLVRSFDFLLKKRYEDGFRLVDRLNGQSGLIMPLALQMLVENAVKHNIISAAKPLTIEIFAENNDYVVVRNNIQPKIKREPSTHFGLQSLIHRYQLLGERPVVVENNVAFFTVKVPIRTTM